MVSFSKFGLARLASLFVKNETQYNIYHSYFSSKGIRINFYFKSVALRCDPISSFTPVAVPLFSATAIANLPVTTVVPTYTEPDMRTDLTEIVAALLPAPSMATKFEPLTFKYFVSILEEAAMSL